MRCARGVAITFHAKLFHNTVFRYKMINYLYENDIYDYSIHFQYPQERKKRKKKRQVKIYISRLHFRLLPIYVKWTSLSSLNGCLLANYVMSCLIILLSFICCFKKKYSSTYANSVNPDQKPHVSGSIVPCRNYLSR